MVEKFKILVADDNPDKRLLLTVALQDAGYEVTCARDGAEALRALPTFEPDLILADVLMPKLDGYELARRVRSDPQTKFIPVMLQTNVQSEAEDVRRGAEVGALAHITDPTDLDLLLAHVRTLLDFKSYLDSCREEAFTDYLTGLANRRHFEKELQKEVGRSHRYDRTLCLLWLDIDDFKQINDKYGHGTGDEVLRTFARVLQRGIRGIDTAARVGGEEFAVLLPETEFEAGCEVAERLHSEIRRLKIQKIERVTASIGVASYPLHAKSSGGLIAIADAAMYEAKREGRDRIGRAKTKTNQMNIVSVRGKGN